MEVLGLALVAVSYCYEMSSSYPCADQVFALFIRHAKHRNLEPVKEVLVFPCLISAWWSSHTRSHSLLGIYLNKQFAAKEQVAKFVSSPTLWQICFSTEQTWSRCSGWFQQLLRAVLSSFRCGRRGWGAAGEPLLPLMPWKLRCWLEQGQN